jgi:hypothetical protein
MNPLVVLLALQAAAPDQELLALTSCQFTLSRAESARGASVEHFRARLATDCRAEEEAFSRRAAAFLRSRGSSLDQARAETQRTMAESRALLVENYARGLGLRSSN